MTFKGVVAVFAVVCLHFVQSQSYVASVVEYNPRIADTAETTILSNVEAYINYIQQARDLGSQIVVFPEYGLTGTDVESNLAAYSTIVPDPLSGSIPYTDTSNSFSKALVDLSAAANERGIYVVVNLIENSTDSSNNTIYYNTNVVFDTVGAVVARYRKINLLNEAYLTAGNEAVIFSTNFGVTFGIFTGNDIVYKNPAINILNNSSVVDIIYPTLWYSEAPFATALSIQAGYSRANGVNLLAASYSQVSADSWSSSGSGIYYYNGTIGETHIFSTSSEKIIAQALPQAPTRLGYVCENAITARSLGGIIVGTAPPIIAFPSSIEDLQNYTSSDLDLRSNYSSQQICSGSFCCSFNISLQNNTDNVISGVYKLLVFQGARRYSNTSLGLRVCGLVACENSQISSCGQISVDPGVTFESISVWGSFPNNSETSYQPATLLTDMKPLTSEYSYCVEGLSGSTSVNVSLTTKSSISGLRTFGIFGRVYSVDYSTPGIKDAGNGLYVSTTFTLLMFAVLKCVV